MDTTASALERALECPASEVMPRVLSSSAYSDRGNNLHAFTRRVVRGVPIEDALVHVAEKWQPTAKAIDFRKLTAGLADIRSERAFAIDTEAQTVRFLGEDIGRRYPERTRAEFAGTEDIGAVASYTKRPVTIDVKTGWEPVSPPDENAQIQFFAARAYLDTGATEVEGRIAYIRESGAVHFDTHVFKRIEIEDFLDDLAELVPRIEAARAQLAETGMVTVAPGKWCRYCPALTSCPSKVGLARTLAGELGDVSRMLTALTPAQRGAAWAKAKEIKSLVDVVLDGLKECATQESFETRGGTKLVKLISFPQTRFAPDKAIALLHELGATREQIDECTSTYQVEQVREVNAPKALGEGKKRKPRAA